MKEPDNSVVSPLPAADNLSRLLNLSEMSGKQISHYLLEEVLGQGGMGVVWKAQDVRLKRTVAIKFLTRLQERGGGDLTSRFQIEAQAAAALDHPSICTVYEIDNHANLWFIAMAYVEGETVSAKIRANRLRVSDALSIAADAGEGLAAAHSRNIIHRDIKSLNIIVTKEGRAKILDFGLASVGWGPQLTVENQAIGTPYYMSPEQIRGKKLDHRTDLWSLGVVLFEMLTGALPFDSDNSLGLQRAIENDRVPPLRRFKRDLPEQLDRILARALAKDRNERFQSATEMVNAIRGVPGMDLSATIVLPATSGRTPRPATRVTPSSSGQLRPIPSIVVLPFVNLSTDPESEYFSDGLTDELINALSQLSTVRVMSRTTSFALKGKSQDLKQLGETLDVSAVLEGSIRKSGNRLRINVQLVQVSDGFQIWSDRFDCEMADVFDVQEQIARKVVDGLKLKWLEGDSRVFANRYTSNTTVYNLYLQGLYHINQLNPASLQKAREYFEQALQEDPNYAPAQAGIARYHSKIAFFNMVAPMEALPRALTAATRALQLDNTLAETHSTLGEVLLLLDWDWAAAEQHYVEAIRRAPGDATLRHPYAMLLMRQGRFDEAYRQVTEAIELDPLSRPLKCSRAYVYFYSRRFEETLKACAKVLELDPNYIEILGCQGLTYLFLDRYDEALNSLKISVEMTKQSSLSLSFYAYGCALAGRKEEARAILQDLLERSRTRYTSPAYIAVVMIGLGEYDDAFEWLNRACDAHDSTMTFAGVLPVFDPLRSDPRYADILEKVGLPRTFHPELFHLREADSSKL